MLTDTAIKQMRPDACKVKKLFDAGRNGLHVLCHPSGKKTFAVKYTHPIKKTEQTLTIGEYPYITLKDARTAAEDAKGLRLRGIDPRENQKRKKEELRAATEDTFEALANEWIRHRGAHWSDTYRHKIRAMLEKHLFPAVGKEPVTQISASRWLTLLRPIESCNRTDLAHTLLQQVGAVYRFAITTDRAVNDPAAALKGALRPHREKNLAALTTPEEFTELLLAMDANRGEYTTRAALEFTMLTFQRSKSIRFAQWNQIDWTNSMWRIPAEIMKMKEPHLVPLSRQAIDLLLHLKPLTRDSEFIFPSLITRLKPISENTMLDALNRMGFKGRMTVHGFRTTASTLLNENNHNPDVIEAALAHTKGDVRSVYNRAKYLAERTVMYQWWADYVDGLRHSMTPISLSAVNAPQSSVTLENLTPEPPFA